MHLKKIILLLIILGLLVPIGSSKIVEKQMEHEPKTDDIHFFLFAIGRVTNFTEQKSGYSTPWYTVECVDVYCVKNLRDRPIIQHLTNNEMIEFDSILTNICYGGYWTAQTDFMIMWFRPLFPLYFLLAACIY
jgi:hypothetical protein